MLILFLLCGIHTFERQEVVVTRTRRLSDPFGSANPKLKPLDFCDRCPMIVPPKNRLKPHYCAQCPFVAQFALSGTKALQWHYTTENVALRVKSLTTQVKEIMIDIDHRLFQIYKALFKRS